MLEQLIPFVPRRFLAAGIASMYLTSSIPTYAQPAELEVQFCNEEKGYVLIGTSPYCVDEFGVLYLKNGEEADNPHQYANIFKMPEFQMAHDVAKAVAQQRKAQQRRDDLDLEDKVEAQAAPPPYLRRGIREYSSSQSPSVPDRFRSPAYSSPLTPAKNSNNDDWDSPPSSPVKNSNNNGWGYALTGLGAVGSTVTLAILIGTNQKTNCEQAGVCYNPSHESDNIFLASFLVGNLALTGIGIYLLSD